MRFIGFVEILLDLALNFHNYFYCIYNLCLV